LKNGKTFKYRLELFPPKSLRVNAGIEANVFKVFNACCSIESTMISGILKKVMAPIE
jgi:hypothetical protein